MLTRDQIIESSNNLVPLKPKFLLNGHIEVSRINKTCNILQLLFRPNHNTTHDRALGQSQRRDVRHLILGTRRQKPNHCDVATVSYSVDALGNRPCSSVLKNEIGTVTIRDFKHLFRPVRVGLVIDNVIGSVTLLDLRELGVR